MMAEFDVEEASSDIVETEAADSDDKTEQCLTLMNLRLSLSLFLMFWRSCLRLMT